MITRSYAKLPAQDVDRARAFYADHFALTPVREHHRHLTYDVAGTTLVVFPSSGRPSGDHDQFGFVTDDLQAEVARLEAEGVRFEDHPPPQGVKAAWFKDSEGNLISLAQFD